MEFKNKLLQKGICPVCGGHDLNISDQISTKAKKKEKTVICNGCKLTIFAEMEG